jgi:hypothetical protein
VVLLSALPWSTLFNQRAQLSSATSEVNELQVENHALTEQARELSENATMAGLARQDYGLVEPGQKAYDILPAPGPVSNDVTAAGHVPLNEPPVVPGSRRSEELLGVGVVSSTLSGGPVSAAAGQGHNEPSTTSNASPSDSSSDSGGFWARVGHTLEFWS